MVSMVSKCQLTLVSKCRARAQGCARVGEARELKVERRPLEVLLLRGSGAGGSYDLVARLVLRGLQLGLARRERGGLQRSGRHKAQRAESSQSGAVGAGLRVSCVLGRTGACCVLAIWSWQPGSSPAQSRPADRRAARRRSPARDACGTACVRL